MNSTKIQILLAHPVVSPISYRARKQNQSICNVDYICIFETPLKFCKYETNQN